MLIRISIWFIALVIYTLSCNELVHRLIKYLKSTRQDSKDPEDKKMGERIRWLGFLEILSYTLSLVFRYPQFIAVWLGVRTVGRWVAHKTLATTVNFFLIGTLLCVLCGVFGGIIFIKFAKILCIHGSLSFLLRN